MYVALAQLGFCLLISGLCKVLVPILSFISSVLVYSVHSYCVHSNILNVCLFVGNVHIFSFTLAIKKAPQLHEHSERTCFYKIDYIYISMTDIYKEK